MCSVFSALCIPSCWRSLARDVMNNTWLPSWDLISQCDVNPQARGGREGQMVTDSSLYRQLETSLEFVSVCIDVVQVNCRFISHPVSTEYIWPTIVSPVNSSQQAARSQLSSNHKFLPIIARSGPSQEPESLIKLVGIH